MSDDARTDTADRPANTSDWRRLLVGAIFVVAVVGIFSYVMTEPSESDELDPLGRRITFSDNFDRADDDVDLNGDGDDWRSERGGWGTQLGAAFVSFPDGSPNVAVTDVADPSARVQAVVGGQSQCGVVARYVNPENYVGLVRVPGFAVWNVVEVVEGSESVIGEVADVQDHDVPVALTVGDNVIEAEVSGRSATLAFATSLDGTSVGMIAMDERGGCTWDDVTVRTSS